MTKEELIRHCERKIRLNKMYSCSCAKKILIEHKIFLELLQGRNINDMFDEKGEYNDENYKGGEQWNTTKLEKGSSMTELYLK